jgi:hypothetical protein
MKKYAGREDVEYPEKAFESTLIIEVKIESMTGKMHGVK